MCHILLQWVGGWVGAQRTFPTTAVNRRTCTAIDTFLRRTQDGDSVGDSATANGKQECMVALRIETWLTYGRVVDYYVLQNQSLVF